MCVCVSEAAFLEEDDVFSAQFGGRHWQEGSLLLPEAFSLLEKDCVPERSCHQSVSETIQKVRRPELDLFHHDAKQQILVTEEKVRGMCWSALLRDFISVTCIHHTGCHGGFKSILNPFSEVLDVVCFQYVYLSK